MRKITIYSEWGGDFTFVSEMAKHDYPNLHISIFHNDKRLLCGFTLHPYFFGYNDCRRNVYVECGCAVNTDIHTDRRIYPFSARLAVDSDYFSVLRFLWRFCDCDDNFDEIVKWLNDTIDYALNGIF